MTAIWIRTVLDTSAIVAYTRESIAVGEVLAEVADEAECAVGLPVLCIVEAAQRVADPHRLGLLLRNPVTVVVTPDPTMWERLSTTCDTVGRVDAASAACLALDEDCDVLTAQPGLYAGLDDGGEMVIPLDPP
jgi:hypothetical protein